MKRIAYFLCFCFLFFAFPWNLKAQYGDRLMPKGFQKMVLLKPTGKEIKGLPEMQVIDEKSPLYVKAHNLMDSSFIGEIINLYLYSQNFLKNNGLVHHIDPAYLALTKNEGGFGKKGFYLLEDGKSVDKSKTPYVDLIETVFDNPAGTLMSVTQLYPHELGHVITDMLVKNGGDERSTKNLEMHYFNLITDYGTAFSEGFSEFIENASRLNEENATIKSGIEKDADQLRNILGNHMIGFSRDYSLFWRLNYYRYSMLLWYQQLESLKRYDLAINGKVKYQNHTLRFNNPEKTILYRNAGLGQDTTHMRNLIQGLSTEGVLSAFFTAQLQQDFKDNYASDHFYRLFYYDTTQTTLAGHKLFSPLENQFLKNLYIFHKYVDLNQETPPPLITYLKGYIKEFPAEEEKTISLFSTIFDTIQLNNLPVSLWIDARNVHHSWWVMDQTGVFAMPDYTFNLNTAEVEDLMMIEGMSEEDAIKVIAWRQLNGYFTSFEDVKKITGLSLNGQELLEKNKFDLAHFNNLESPQKNFMSIIWSGLLWLLIRSLVWFVIIMGILLLMQRIKLVTLKLNFLHILGNLGYWLIFVIAGLGFAVKVHNPLLYMLLFIGIMLLINGLIFRKKRGKMITGMIATLLMGLIVILSL